MTSFRILFLGVSLAAVFLAYHAAEGQEDQEFEHEVRYLNERYEDFFKHEEAAQRHRSQIQAGVPEVKSVRQVEMDEYERARREHIQNRQPPADNSAAEAEWLMEQERLKEAYEQTRRAQVERRQQLHQIRETARKIPEAKDAGLE